jgi:hypothetical protein
MADIKDKIKKLLSLAQSPNENEARDALLKARELMAKNKLSDADFGDTKDKKVVTISVGDIKWTTDSGNIWMTSLCKIITDNNCCVSAWCTNKGCRTHTLTLMGFEDDVKICEDMIRYAVGFVNGQIKILQKKLRTQDPASVASSYAKGFVIGLEFAYEEQKDEHPEWGLVVVKPQEVQDLESKLGQRNVRTKRHDFDPMAYAKGQQDGQNFNKRKPIECQKVG